MGNPEITVVDTIPEHIGLMADAMQQSAIDIARRMGVSPKRALWRSYRQSLICKTIFINDKIAAIFGIGGEIFNNTGRPWLILAPIIEAYPFKVAYRYRQELKNMHKLFPILEDYVHENDEKSIRMLELMGFKFGKERIKFKDAVMLRAERIM